MVVIALLAAVQWGEPALVGPEVISSDYSEIRATVSPDGNGKTLLFASNGRGGQGRHDLFIARANNHTWGRATPLPGAINSPVDEFDASFLDDGNTVVFARSVNVETETITLHVAQRGAAGYERGTPLPFSAKYQYALGPALDWHNSGQLYFSAAPLTSKNGRADVYSVRYRIKTP